MVDNQRRCKVGSKELRWLFNLGTDIFTWECPSCLRLRVDYSAHIDPTYGSRMKARIGSRLTGDRKTAFVGWVTDSSEQESTFYIGDGPDIEAHTRRKIAETRNIVPVYLGRVYSLSKVGHTVGLTSPEISLPNAHWHNLRGDKFPMPQRFAELRHRHAHKMLIDHVSWLNRKEDLLLSWTNSLLFELSHAVRRYELGQFGVYLAIGWHDRLKSFHGSSVPFHHAPTLHRILHHDGMVASSRRVSWRRNRGDHLKRWQVHHSNHEYVSFGDIFDAEHAVKHVSLEALIRNGLLELIPELHVFHDEGDEFKIRAAERVGFWGHQVWLRNQLFDRAAARPITVKHILICRRLAKLFANPDEKAPFWIFVHFLAHRKRPFDNRLFVRYVMIVYNLPDILNGCYEQMHRVPASCPDVIQTIRLVHEAMGALGYNGYCRRHVHIIPHGQAERYNYQKQQFLDIDDDSAELLEENRYDDTLRGRVYRETLGRAACRERDGVPGQVRPRTRLEPPVVLEPRSKIL